MNTTVQGSCLCGSIRYAADAPFEWMAYCHCSMCRKDTGGLFDTAVGVAKERFRWIAGMGAIMRYDSAENSHRAFCGHCGSSVPYDIQSSGIVGLPAGGLDDDPGIKPTMHIFVRDKSPSMVIRDALPQFAARPDDRDAEPVERPTPTLRQNVVQGSCLCGDIAYEFDGTPTRMVSCHCSRCRKSRGTAHGSNVFVAQEKFRWTRGADGVKTYRPPDAKFFTTCFCGRCGGLLPALFEVSKRYLVPAGSLDTPIATQPTVHLYVASKAPWFEICDAAPQFAEMPPRERLFELMFEPKQA